MSASRLSSVFVYAILVAAVLYGVFSLSDRTDEQSATMAPDLQSPAQLR